MNRCPICQKHTCECTESQLIAYQDTHHQEGAVERIEQELRERACREDEAEDMRLFRRDERRRRDESYKRGVHRGHDEYPEA